jgi:hypothetical protein
VVPGHDTDDVLRSVGVSDEEIVLLHERGVIG